LGDNVICLDAPGDVCYVTAGAMLLSEGRVSNINELITFLNNAGLPADRQGKVVESLTPFAEVVFNTRG
jgi:TolB-like protein